MAITFKVSTSAASTNATDVTTSGIDTSGSDLIAVWVSGAASTNQPPSDNKGNTANYLPGTLVEVGGGERGRLYYAKQPLVGTGHTFSVTGGYLPSLCVMAFSGCHLTSPLDLEAAGGTGFATTVQPGSLTPSAANYLVLQGLSFNLAGTISINGSYTGLLQENRTANAMGGALAYWIEGAATATNPTWTTTVAASLAAIGASFKSGTPPVPPSGARMLTNRQSGASVFGV